MRQTWHRHWLVDPLDGTRGFIARNAEFTVNIALIENHQPILGVLYSPVNQHCFYAEKNCGAFLITGENATPIALKSASVSHSLRFVCGRFDRSMQLKEKLHELFSSVTMMQMNSAIKFGIIAQGLGDLYVRLGKTSEWDTAAGQCILEEAGGLVVDFQGNRLQYNTQSSLINPYFLAIGDRSQCARYVEWIHKIVEKNYE
ncbi:MAG: 3'(2'),5'-bisphosphate nucleotidase [uncultured bacterium]|nr:MAG: 3'(2'),5'-bisphosphate nucleotidase [uncultured bacterium]